MECVISSASGSTGISNTLIQKLPGTIFTIITIVIFIYVLVQITRSFQAAQQGNEVSSLLIPPVILMAGLVVIGLCKIYFLVMELVNAKKIQASKSKSW